MVGVINTVVGIAIYPLLLLASSYLNKHYMVALGISQAICLTLAFAMHKIIVFQTRANIFREFRAFAAFYLFNYGVNWLLLPLMVSQLHLHPAVAQSIFVVALIIGSYFWHSKITFKD